MICTPTIARISVVLPQPLGPSRPLTVPGATETEPPRSTRLPPRTTIRPSTSMAAGSVNRARVPAPGGQRVEHGLLGRQPVGRLLPDHRCGAVDHRFRDLVAAMGGQAVQEDR